MIGKHQREAFKLLQLKRKESSTEKRLPNHGMGELASTSNTHFPGNIRGESNSTCWTKNLDVTANPNLIVFQTEVLSIALSRMLALPADRILNYCGHI